MTNLPIILLLLLSIFGVDTGFAQSGPAPNSSEEHPTETAPVIIDDITLFSVRGTQAGSAEERAEVIGERIREVAADRSIAAASLTVVETEYSTDIMAGQQKLLSIFDADVMRGIPRQALARAYLAKIQSAIDRYRRDRSPGNIVKGAVYSLLVIAALIALLLLLRRLYRRLYSLLEQRYKSRVHALHIQSVEFVRVERVWAWVTGTLRTVRLILLLILFYFCLHLVLGFFPWTRLFAAHLKSYGIMPVLMIWQGLLKHVPNLFFIAVLIVLTRYFLKLLGLFFAGLENRTLSISGFDPDWSRPTYKLVRVLVVLFALVVAYPYIPGSESPAFKGLSVFLGVLFSLGSSSAISNVVAGYMMTYRRAFKVGDRVKIQDFTGDVTKIRLQATHLRTVKNEEVIVPNSSILAGHVVNYSSLAKEHGLILHTSVTIGYDVPWRQVDGMLLRAAERTERILREPKPFVLHTSLDDFFVSYELNVYTDTAQGMMQSYSDLHRNILDVFNEYGVQIMSPHYENDPAEIKVVPRAKWFESPAEDSATEGNGSGQEDSTGRTAE